MSEVRLNAPAKETFGVRLERGRRIRAAMLRRAEFVRTLRNGRAPFALSERLFDGNFRKVGDDVGRLMHGQIF